MKWKVEPQPLKIYSTAAKTFLFFLEMKGLEFLKRLQKKESIDPEFISQDAIGLVESSVSDPLNTDHYLEITESKLHKNLGVELDNVFDGKNVSRCDLFDDDGNDGMSDEEPFGSRDGVSDEDEMSDEEPFGNHDGVSEISDEEPFGNHDGVSEMSDEEPFGSIPQESDHSISDNESESSSETESNKKTQELISLELEKQNQEETKMALKMSESAKSNIEKGRRVRNQLRVYESILDDRIRIQPLLASANRLPRISFDCLEAKNGVTNIIHSLMDLSANLMSSLGLQTRKRKQTDDLTELFNEIRQLDESFQSYQTETLDKWFSKTSVTNLKTINQPPTTQIKNTLLDMDRLREKTRLNRSDLVIIGSTAVSSSVEIYDDTDFYTQLLREYIASKDPNSSLHSVAVKKSVGRRKIVDTRASKGRKVRFDIHDKLVGFTAPTPCFGWHDEMINEFFSGLFGSRPRILENKAASITGTELTIFG